MSSSVLTRFSSQVIMNQELSDFIWPSWKNFTKYITEVILPRNTEKTGEVKTLIKLAKVITHSYISTAQAQES